MLTRPINPLPPDSTLPCVNNLRDLVLCQRYQIIIELGRGSSGRACKAKDLQTDQVVVVKILPRTFTYSEYEMQKFARLFERVRAIHHDNLVELLAFMQDEATGLHFVVSTYVEGLDLIDWYRAYDTGNEIVNDTVAAVIYQIAVALDVSHQKRIFHRGLKPANILVQADGKVKLIDTAISAQIHAALLTASVPSTSIGSSDLYFAPEQWEGYIVTAETDLYAFATIIYELFAGHPPFDVTTQHLLREQVLHASVLPIPTVSLAQNAVFIKALAKRPHDRYATCMDFVRALVSPEKDSVVAQGDETENVQVKQGLSPLTWKVIYGSFAIIGGLLLLSGLLELISFGRKWQEERAIIKQAQHVEVQRVAHLQRIQEQARLEQFTRETKMIEAAFSQDALKDPLAIKKVLELAETDVAQVLQVLNELQESVIHLTHRVTQAEEKSILLEQQIQADQVAHQIAEEERLEAEKQLLLFDEAIRRQREVYTTQETQRSPSATLKLTVMLRGKPVQAKLSLQATSIETTEVGETRVVSSDQNVIVQKAYNYTIHCDYTDENGLTYVANVPELLVDWNTSHQITIFLGQVMTPGKPFTLDLTQLTNQTYSDGSRVLLEMIWCDPGSFTMGDTQKDTPVYSPDEKAHLVKLTQGFWLAKHEFTQQQWRTIVPVNPSQWKGERRPVDTVSWEMADSACKILTIQAQYGGLIGEMATFALPTEAQWEYACRAGTTTPYAVDLNAEQEGALPFWSLKRSGFTSHEVGHSLSNAWGFYDMHGNAMEWCADWYAPYYTDEQTDPKGPTRGAMRVVRGGSWKSLDVFCRSTSRRGSLDLTQTKDDTCGFRPALYLK